MKTKIIQDVCQHPQIKGDAISIDGWYRPCDSDFSCWRILFIEGIPSIAVHVVKQVVYNVSANHSWFEHNLTD